MGCKNSKVMNYHSYTNNEWIIAKKNADALYQYRIKNYNPLLHGTRKYYMSKVQNEYKLGCIPTHLRSNNNFDKIYS